MYGNGCDNPTRQPKRNMSRGSSAYPRQQVRATSRQWTNNHRIIVRSLPSSSVNESSHRSVHVSSCLFFCSVFVSSLTVIPFLYLFPSCVFGNLKKSRWITASRNPCSLLIHLCLLNTATCRLYGAYTRSNIITSWCSCKGFCFRKEMLYVWVCVCVCVGRFDVH